MLRLPRRQRGQTTHVTQGVEDEELAEVKISPIAPEWSRPAGESRRSAGSGEASPLALPFGLSLGCLRRGLLGCRHHVVERFGQRPLDPQRMLFLAGHGANVGHLSSAPRSHGTAHPTCRLFSIVEVRLSRKGHRACGVEANAAVAVKAGQADNPSDARSRRRRGWGG